MAAWMTSKTQKPYRTSHFDTYGSVPDFYSSSADQGHPKLRGAFAAAAALLLASAVIATIKPQELWVPSSSAMTSSNQGTATSETSLIARPALTRPAVQVVRTHSASTSPLFSEAGPDSPLAPPQARTSNLWIPGLLAVAAGTIAFASTRQSLPQSRQNMQLKAMPNDDDDADVDLEAMASRMVKVYVIPEVEDAACVKLANGEYHSLQPAPEKNDPEADALQESFDDTLPACFNPNNFRILSEVDLMQNFQEIDFGTRSEHLGSMTAMGPDVQSLQEAADILREEADALDDMHKRGWNFDGLEEGWCSAITNVAVEPDGRAKVYILPDDDAAAAVKLVTGQYHILRPRLPEDEGLMVDRTAEELDEAWQRMSEDIPEGVAGPERPVKEEKEDDFRYVEAIEDTLVPPFSEKHTRMMRLADLQQDYDVVFGTDAFNYGESIDFDNCTNLQEVAQKLREKADELIELEKRGWTVDGTDGEWLMLQMELEPAK